MIREPLVAKSALHENGFRWRGHEVSRLEGFSDAVFGFALTLLVVSLEVPHTFAELMHVIREFLGFLVCFVLFVQIWMRHYQFFRRYGLQDVLTRAANAALLFVILAYVYPLKFLFSQLMGIMIWGDPQTVVLADGSRAPVLTDGDVPTLFIVYAAGVILVYAVFILLYAHAWRQREALALDPLERLETKASIGECLIMIAGALVSTTFAVGGRPDLAGWSYGLYAPAFTAFGFAMGARRKRLLAAPTAPTPVAASTPSPPQATAPASPAEARPASRS